MWLRTMRAGLAAVVVVLTGCSPGGVAGSNSDDELRSCLEGAGVSPAQAADWSVEQERRFLQDPETMDCIVANVAAERLPDVLARTFPAREEGEAPSDARVDLVTRYTAGQPESRPVGEVIARVGALLRAFRALDGLSDTDPDESRDGMLLHLVAWELYVRETGGPPPGYRQWLAGGETDDPQRRIEFLLEAERKGASSSEQIDELVERIEAAQHD